MLTLSDKWEDVLRSQPENGMGYQIATVTLKDGRRFPRTLIVGMQEIDRIGDELKIPFKEADIESIVVDPWERAWW
jgi:hypothetical protein